MCNETRKKQACDSRENKLQSCSTDLQQPHFVSQRTEDKSCIWPDIFCVRTACALGFSRSDPGRTYFEVYAYRFVGLSGQLKHFGRFPRRLFSFSKSISLEKMGKYKSKQQEEAPSKQSAPKGLKVMPYMEL